MQMSAMPGASPCTNRPVRASPASIASSGAKLVATQWRNQSATAASSAPNRAVSDFSTRRLLSGWISQAIIMLSALTRARSAAASGSSAGVGWVSSSHSMIASDWVSTSPPGSSNAGTSPCGLRARNSGAFCAPVFSAQPT